MFLIILLIASLVATVVTEARENKLAQRIAYVFDFIIGIATTFFFRDMLNNHYILWGILLGAFLIMLGFALGALYKMYYGQNQ